MAMPQFGAAALSAASQIMRMAMVAKAQAPTPSQAAPGKMGRIYDLWLTQGVQASQSASQAVDLLYSLLPNNHMQKSFKHMQTMCNNMQDALEGALQYHSPHSTQKVHGVVWTDSAPEQVWFKAQARRVHRAALMELLLLHAFKLEYALLLAHTSDSQAFTTLLGRPFEAEYKETMLQLYEFLRQPSLDLTSGFVCDMTEAECMDWVLDALENYDLSRDWLDGFLAAQGGSQRAIVHWALRDLVLAPVRAAGAAAIAAAAGVAGAPLAAAAVVAAAHPAELAALQLLRAPGNSALVRRIATEVHAELVAAGPVVAGGRVAFVGAAGAFPAAGQFPELLQGFDMAAAGADAPLAAAMGGLQPHFTNVIRTQLDHLWHRATVGELWGEYNHYMQHRESFQRQTPGVPQVAAFGNIGYPGAVPAGGHPPATAAHVNLAWARVEPHLQRRERASVLLVRHRAFSALLRIAESYKDAPLPGQPAEAFGQLLLRETSDAFYELMGLYDLSQTQCLRFRPTWSGRDQRDLLATSLRQEKEYACLLYRNAVAQVGQFIMRRLGRNVTVQQRTIVHEWWRRSSGGMRPPALARQPGLPLEHRVFWGVVHSETPALADLIFLMAPVVLGNRKTRTRALPPVHEIHLLLTRAVCRFDLAQNDEGGVLEAEDTGAAPYYFGHAPAGGAFPAPQGLPARAVCRTLKDALDVLGEPDGTTAHTTQPMTEAQRTWLLAVRDAWDLADPPGGRTMDVWVNHRPLTANALIRRALKAVPQGNPEKPVDGLETDIVVWRREPPFLMWMQAKTGRLETAEEFLVTQAMTSAHTFTSQVLVHGTQALWELQNAFTANPREFVLYGNANNIVT